MTAAPLSLPLLHGTSIPPVGLGTWPFVGNECEAVVSTALEIGYRLIDTSHKYGNEAEVGRAIRSSGVDRGELFVTSKFNREDHSRDGVRRAYDRSLAVTGLDYLDLFLIHWPVSALDRYVEAWEGLVDLVQSGAVRAIGGSNFKPAHLDRIVSASGYVPDVNQIQLSVDLPRLRSREAHAERGILTEGWSPLGRGAQLREDPRVVAVATEGSVAGADPPPLAGAAGDRAGAAIVGPRSARRQPRAVRLRPLRGPDGFSRDPGSWRGRRPRLRLARERALRARTDEGSGAIRPRSLRLSDGRCAQACSRPPLTCIVCPVMKPLAPESRNSTAPTMSSGCASRCRLWPASMAVFCASETVARSISV